MNPTAAPSAFQFHKGTIKTRISPHFALRLINFTSITVRLKQSSDAGSGGAGEFQFHKGTIKTF